MANKFEAKESYTHKFAKELLWSWLTDGWSNNDEWYGPGITIKNEDNPDYEDKVSYRSDFIHMEYPITKTFPYLLDEGICNDGLPERNKKCVYREPGCYYGSAEYEEFMKTYQPRKYSPCLTCKEFMKREPLLAVADIAVEHKGNIVYVFEITHKNELSEEKTQLYLDLMEKNGYHTNIFEIEARHILGQIKKPNTLYAKQIL